MHITLKYLKYFIVSAKYGNFSKAAEELYISKSSIMNAIDNLEHEFGFDLFIRLPAKGIVLTAEGSRILKSTQLILNDVKNYTDEVANIGGTISGSLTIGCYEVLAPHVMPTILRVLKQNYPDLSVTVQENNMVEVQDQALDGKTDVILSYNKPKLSSSLLGERLKRVYPYALMTREHPLAANSSVTLEDLVEFPMILMDLTQARDVYTNYFDIHNYKPNIILRTKALEAARGYVEAGFGFTILHLRPPYWSSVSDNLVYKQIADEVPENYLIAGYVKPKSGVPHKKIEAVMNTLRLLFQEGGELSALFI
jgi:DNA-binding transcriptional LysR family regulator